MAERTIKERLAVIETEMLMIKKALFLVIGGTMTNIGFTIW